VVDSEPAKRYDRAVIDVIILHRCLERGRLVEDPSAASCPLPVPGKASRSLIADISE